MRRKKKNVNDVHYVNATLFREEILKSKELDELTPEALKMLVKMCNKISLVYSYKYTQDREDCISFAILDVLSYWRGYNEEKSTNTFAYFTRLIWNGLKKGWKKLYPQKSTTKITLNNDNIFNV